METECLPACGLSFCFAAAADVAAAHSAATDAATTAACGSFSCSSAAADSAATDADADVDADLTAGYDKTGCAFCCTPRFFYLSFCIPLLFS